MKVKAKFSGFDLTEGKIYEVIFMTCGVIQADTAETKGTSILLKRMAKQTERA